MRLVSLSNRLSIEVPLVQKDVLERPDSLEGKGSGLSFNRRYCFNIRDHIASSTELILEFEADSTRNLTDFH